MKRFLILLARERGNIVFNRELIEIFERRGEKRKEKKKKEKKKRREIMERTRGSREQCDQLGGGPELELAEEEEEEEEPERRLARVVMALTCISSAAI